MKSISASAALGMDFPWKIRQNPGSARSYLAAQFHTGISAEACICILWPPNILVPGGRLNLEIGTIKRGI